MERENWLSSHLSPSSFFKTVLFLYLQIYTAEYILEETSMLALLLILLEDCYEICLRLSKISHWLCMIAL